MGFNSWFKVLRSSATLQNMCAFTVTIVYQYDSLSLVRDWQFLNVILP